MRRVAVPLDLTPDAARPRDGRDVVLSGPTMGVTWTLRARAPDSLGDGALRTAVQDACDRVVAQMSHWEPDSDLSRFNRAPAGSWIPLPEEFEAVISAALEVAEATGGAFDPTLGRLTDLWGFGPAGPIDRPPPVLALNGPRTGWCALRLEAGRLLQPGGAALDLSGIAKGYGVDLVARALAALGVRDYLVEIGGELRGSGVKGDGQPWWVELERPPDASLGDPPLLVALHGLSVATSGDWRRSFVADGRRYSHTLDPAARSPVSGATAAVTVLHPECHRADALCTALMVLGPEAGAFAEAHDVAALILTRTREGYAEVLTPALERLLA